MAASNPATLWDASSNPYPARQQNAETTNAVLRPNRSANSPLGNSAAITVNEYAPISSDTFCIVAPCSACVYGAPFSIAPGYGNPPNPFTCRKRRIRPSPAHPAPRQIGQLSPAHSPYQRWIRQTRGYRVPRAFPSGAPTPPPARNPCKLPSASSAAVREVASLQVGCRCWPQFLYRSVTAGCPS